MKQALKRKSKRKSGIPERKRKVRVFHVRGQLNRPRSFVRMNCGDRASGLVCRSNGNSKAQRIPALKEIEESSRKIWELNWVVTPADGPCFGSVSLFLFGAVEARLVLRCRIC